MERPDGTTHFGFRDVELGEKQTLVNEVFHSVAKRYDLMNDLMSGGMHRLWKEAMITALNPPRSDAPFALLDVAGGTGDISFRAAKAAGHGFHATVCDINTEMLAVGRERAEAQHLDHQVSFVEGNAEALAFPDKSFDAYTIAFGIRNVPRIDKALKSSADADGQTGATQASNQLLGINASQLAQIQSLLAAQSRALTTERLERVAREQRAQEIQRRAFPAEAGASGAPARSSF